MCAKDGSGTHQDVSPKHCHTSSAIVLFHLFCGFVLCKNNKHCQDKLFRIQQRKLKRFPANNGHSEYVIFIFENMLHATVNRAHYDMEIYYEPFIFNQHHTYDDPLLFSIVECQSQTIAGDLYVICVK